MKKDTKVRFLFKTLILPLLCFAAFQAVIIHFNEWYEIRTRRLVIIEIAKSFSDTTAAIEIVRGVQEVFRENHATISAHVSLQKTIWGTIHYLLTLVVGFFIGLKTSPLITGSEKED